MRSVLLFAGYLIGTLVVLATVLALLPVKKWWARLCDFVPLQLLVMFIISVFLFIAGKETELSAFDFIFLLTLLLCVSRLVFLVYPYTPFHRYQTLPADSDVSEGSQLSLVYCNVEMKNRQHNKLLSVVTRQDPDMILFAETDDWWKNHLEVLKETYSYYRELPLDNTYGMLFYSKIPFENDGFTFLVEKDVPSLHVVLTLADGKNVQCYFIHPRPPVPGESNDSEERDTEMIIVAKKAKASELPVIIAGDLNDVGWSPSSLKFQKTGGLLDPRVGRGLYATFNARYPIFRWPLDHIFHTDHFRIIDIKKLGFTGSDHFPIYVKFSVVKEVH